MSNSDYPPCIKQGCPRRSRSKQPGMCATCRTREYTGASPMIPVDPLLDYMEARGIGWPRDRSKPRRGTKALLEHLDAICIDHLEVHPAVVYGSLYYQECVA